LCDDPNAPPILITFFIAAIFIPRVYLRDNSLFIRFNHASPFKLCQAQSKGWVAKPEDYAGDGTMRTEVHGRPTQLPNCKQCGTPLFTYTPGDMQEYCPTCQAAIEAQRKQVVSTRQLVFRLPITSTLIVINILVFLAMVLKGISPIDPSVDQMLHWGAQFGPFTLGGQWWRLFSSMFLHHGILHLGLNMWCLWNLGLLAESLLGRWTYLAVYLATGIGADLLSLAWDPMRVSAGASGAIFGLAGVLITSLYFTRLAVPRDQLRGILRSVVVFAVLNLAIGFGLAVVDNMAHLGGLLTGLAIGLALAQVLSRPKEQRAPGKLIVMIAAVVVLAVGAVVVQHEQAYAIPLYKIQQ
jgi:rhomboid protease GluP